MSSESFVFDQVVLFGDSITQQSWGHTDGLGATLTNLYQRKLDVVNRGLSGYNTKWAIPIIQRWLPRAEEQPNRPKIKLMTIWLGANDAACPPSPQAVTVEEYKVNLKTLIGLIRSPSSPYYSPSTHLLLLTPTPVSPAARSIDLKARDRPFADGPPDRTHERTLEFAEAAKEVGESEGVHVVDLWKGVWEAAGEKEEGLDKYLSDGLHLTGEGYAVCSGMVKQAIATHFPQLHWDNLTQTFPHWADIVNEGALGKEYRVQN